MHSILRFSSGGFPWGLAVVVCAGLVMSTPSEVSAQGPEDRFVGDWQGTLNAGGQELPLVFHIVSTDAGLTATMDSPAQAAFGIGVDAVEIRGDSLTLTIRPIQGRYDGVLQEDGTITGTWSQGPASLPLNLAPAEEGGAGAAAPAVPDPSTRPQTPRAPFPYDVEDVTFPQLTEDFDLAGTLTVPRGRGPVPGVVLVSGSGPQDRDETLLGHKPFAVLADHLTRAGIAVLRYDDRGVGSSGGEFASATSADLAGDAESAVAWLRERPEVAAGRVGIVGHSEGGLIAPMVASRSDAVAFVVLLAGPGMTGEEIILDQSRRIAEADGADPALVERGLKVNRRLFEVIRTEADPQERRDRAQAILEEALDSMTPEERQMQGITEETSEAWVNTQLAQLTSPWFSYFLTYDPVPALEATRVPVLALNGELDLQVPYQANLSAIRAALERGGNEDFTVESLPGLNHLFQRAETGAPSEYARIEETMTPAVMDRTAAWILERFGPR
jgi:fermentation-respiration switch protein FrsA (DUF1100 family)